MWRHKDVKLCDMLGFSIVMLWLLQLKVLIKDPSPFFKWFVSTYHIAQGREFLTGALYWYAFLWHGHISHIALSEYSSYIISQIQFFSFLLNKNTKQYKKRINYLGVTQIE